MLITNKFIFVHHPKTGGTFVSRALLRIHGLDQSDVSIRGETNRVFGTPHGTLIIFGKHNACADIPVEQRGKKVLGVVRNPFDRYVSSYVFGWWKKPEYLEQYRQTIEDLDRRYPGFPDIGFNDFLKFQNERKQAGGNDIGSETVAFIRRYFNDPERVLAKLGENYFTSGGYREDMFDIHFLRTDDLNQGLHDFLLAAGYPAADIAFILDIGKVLPKVPPEGKRREDVQSWEAYYSPESKAFVRRRERHLFTLFPEFDR